MERSHCRASRQRRAGGHHQAVRALIPLRRALLLAFVAAPFLGACELLPKRAVAARRPPRDAITRFNLDGRLSVRQGDARHHVDIAWRHAADADNILLTTPLGQGVAELVRDAAGARLQTADRQEHAAADWEALSARVFGFTLPLSGLPRWLLGDVTPTQRDAGNRPLRASIDGWRIDYLRYENDAADALPELLEFRRDDIEVRLKVDAWQLD